MGRVFPSLYYRFALMTVFQTNIFQTISVPQNESLEIIDLFDVQWKKIIELSSHSSLTYLIVGSDMNIDIQLITKWSSCTCKIFGLFSSDITHSVRGSIKIALDHSGTSANVELFSFLHDGAKVNIDGSIDITSHLDQVHGRLIEHNIILGKNVSLKTLPKLNVSSHNVRAAHGANIDTLDAQKLFYMMSRGLTQKQSQTLLVNWYIDYVLSHFKNIGEKEKNNICAVLVK